MVESSVLQLGEVEDAPVDTGHQRGNVSKVPGPARLKSGLGAAPASRLFLELAITSLTSHRARRVKCDETKPACLRCYSAGRQCEGYRVQPKYHAWLYQKPTAGSGKKAVPHNTGIVTRPFLLDLPGMGSKERQNFDVFRHHTAQDLAGLFQCAFWTRVVLQMSHSEPAVLHASLALAALHQKSVMDGMSTPVQDVTNKAVQFGLLQVNQSIRLLQRRLEDTRDAESSRILLTCCILFISIEMLRGHYDSAMLHLYNGRNILANHLASGRGLGPGDTLILPSTSMSIEDGLVDIFAQLDIQSTNFGLNAPRFHLLTEGMSTSAEARIRQSFSGLREAKQCLDSTANAIHRFLTMSTDPAFHRRANPVAVAQQTKLLAQLQDWLQAFENRTPCTPTSSSLTSEPMPRDRKAATVLHLHHTFLRVKLSASLCYGVEIAYDEFTNDFGAIVSLAEHLLGHASPTNADSSYPPRRLLTFSLDVGLIQPVYFTALKCRVPKLRRRALSALASTSHRESMWDATLFATFAARIIQLEEAAALALPGGIPTDSLPELARFCEVRVLISGEGDGELRCIASNDTRMYPTMSQFEGSIVHSMAGRS